MSEATYQTLQQLCEEQKNIDFRGESGNKSVDEWIKIMYEPAEETDREHCHTDKYYVHSYIPEYDELFARFRGKDANVLEIGLAKGGSLNLWRKYFVENCSIVGLDISPAPEWLSTIPDITTHRIDAYSSTALALFDDRSFDIIIDDGPHTLESMKYVAQYYLHKLKTNGIAIIEDIPSYEWIEDILQAIPDNITFEYEVHDLRETKNRYDDILLVILVT